MRLGGDRLADPYTVQFLKDWIEKCKECMENYERETDPSTIPTDAFKCQKISIARCFPCMFRQLEILYDEEAPAETLHFWLRMLRKCMNCMLKGVGDTLPKLEKKKESGA